MTGKRARSTWWMGVSRQEMGWKSLRRRSTSAVALTRSTNMSRSCSDWPGKAVLSTRSPILVGETFDYVLFSFEESVKTKEIGNRRLSGLREMSFQEVLAERDVAEGLSAAVALDGECCGDVAGAGAFGEWEFAEPGVEEAGVEAVAC